MKYSTRIPKREDVSSIFSDEIENELFTEQNVMCVSTSSYERSTMKF